MISKLDNLFVDTIPDDLEDGILYISIRFRVIMHNCCCGCKNKVVTPLSPVRWQMTFDGKSVSLSPSIGNWNFKCRSHYWITRNEVEWARKWSEIEITEARNYVREKRGIYYNQNKPVHIEEEIPAINVKPTLFNKIKIFAKRILDLS